MEPSQGCDGFRGEVTNSIDPSIPAPRITVTKSLIFRAGSLGGRLRSHWAAFGVLLQKHRYQAIVCIIQLLFQWVSAH